MTLIYKKLLLGNPKYVNRKTGRILEGSLWLKKCWFANDNDDDGNILSLH
jgi:hypothetical protein